MLVLSRFRALASTFLRVLTFAALALAFSVRALVVFLFLPAPAFFVPTPRSSISLAARNGSPMALKSLAMASASFGCDAVTSAPPFLLAIFSLTFAIWPATPLAISFALRRISSAQAVRMQWDRSSTCWLVSVSALLAV